MILDTENSPGPIYDHVQIRGPLEKTVDRRPLVAKISIEVEFIILPHLGEGLRISLGVKQVRFWRIIDTSDAWIQSYGDIPRTIVLIEKS